MIEDNRSVQQGRVSTYPHPPYPDEILSHAAREHEIDRSEKYGVPDVSYADLQFSFAKA